MKNMSQEGKVDVKVGKEYALFSEPQDRPVMV